MVTLGNSAKECFPGTFELKGHNKLQDNIQQHDPKAKDIIACKQKR
jgi:hypothetical protein